MASVFTYDPDPPRVSSPWILADDADTSPASGAAVTQTGLLSEYGVTRLDAEPQTGPIEYKLHLLLRSRRSYMYMSTVDQKRDRLHAQPGDGSALYSASPASYSASPTPASSSQPRQERLQRLTTQLLWRLQQSSPYHASSSREVKIPKLPDGNADTDSPDLYGTQIPGLEESQGALYEIGVSDDGHLVGLAKDELDESIATLRVMAASLGCGVTVLRMVNVGDCEWIEIADLNGNASQGPTQITKRDRLWVAEALITPSTELLHSKDTRRYNESADGTPLDSAASTTVPGHGKSATPQLRVTLTGPIASGKSSLLGTLSTGTLDNGRGKSRLSLLKHRHEMASGMTSSIAQELIGYQERLIFSFSHRNIESWLDIHDYANDGRLVFMSDSGGHPRYRHTVFRGLMNWAPHWMVLCVAADDADEMTSRAHDVTAPAPDSGETDLVKAHLDLSLKLDVPLAIVITKLDLASKVALQKTMTKILGAIRDADRVPKLLQPDQQPRDQLSEIPQTDWDKVQSFVGNISEHGDLLKHVPIVFTSVLKGVGIGLVHALLASLPLPPAPTPHGSKDATPQSQQPRNLFHIDDTFSLPRSFDDSLANLDGVIVSGHVRLGSFSIGQTIVVGPFSSSHALDRGSGTEYHSSPEGRGSPALRVISATHPNGNKSGSISPSTDPDEWQKARIVSIRNLRLPVGTLEAGQVGSIGLVFETDRSDLTVLPDTPQIRRGMVISTPTLDMPDNEIPLHASHGVIAVFEEDSAQFPPSGTLVNILFACVRTAARILDVSVQHRGEAGETIGPLDADHKAGTTKDSLGDTVTKVTLELVHSRKWAEPGSSVIIMGNGSHDGSGLQGFVGKITDVMC